jgi:HK97 family phage portal protein
MIRNLLGINVKNYGLDNLDQYLHMWLGGGMPTNSGVMVNEVSALRHITVYSCVRVRSESFAMLPLTIYKRRSKGKGQDEAWNHPLYQILHSTPNEDMTSMTWRETVNGHLDLSGNTYSIINTNQRGQIIELYPWDWHMIQPFRDTATGEIKYQVNDRGKTEILPKDRVFHVPGLGFDGIQGYSTIRMAKEAVGLGLAVSEFSERFFGQGMNVGTILETEKTFKSQDELDMVRSQFEERYSGLNNSHRPIVLHGGLKFNRIPMPLTDAQFIETTKLNMEQICGLYRVPPHLVANLDRATFSNIEQQSIEFVVYSMLPLINRFEQTMNWKLFTPAERAAGYYTKFNLDGLLRGDAIARAEALAKKRQNGIINANEWRELDDQNPIEGPAGEAYLVNGNMISTETASKQVPKQTGGGEPSAK